MLQKLRIKNIALIDECVIEFESGLNTLTGETGAGKSIIIDSLNFVLGARGDKSLIKSGTDVAKVDAIFSTDDEDVFSILSDVGIEKDSTIIVSRTMSLAGKNECRINGEVVPLSVIKKVTSRLVDVFGQNDQQFLLDSKQHLSFLDSFDGEILQADKDELGEQLNLLSDIKKSIQLIGGDGEERLRNIDILKYQINEIASSNLKDGEEDELFERKNVLKNSEKIIEKFNEFDYLSDGQVSIVSNLKSMANILNSLGEYLPECDNFSDRINSAKLEVEDVVESVKDISSRFEYNENELNDIEERLDLIKTLERKYGSSIADILKFQQNAVENLAKLENATEELQQLNAKRTDCLEHIFVIATHLTEKRQKVAKEFEKRIIEQLKKLGMKSADFKVNFRTYDRSNIESIISCDGADDIEFLFSANLGEPLKPLVKIISGGELSRFMLAFKTVINNFVNKTYVFDEIDTGIGGGVGTVVAKQMTQIAQINQVLCVTHLAQISCFADNMLKISKYEADGRTFTSVKPLVGSEKVEEVMRLIGTNEVSEWAYKHAEELIREANDYKKMLK